MCENPSIDVVPADYTIKIFDKHNDVRIIIIAAVYSYYFIHHSFDVFDRFRELTQQKTNIHSGTTIKISQGVDKRPPLQHQVLYIAKGCQSPQKFFLAVL